MLLHVYRYFSLACCECTEGCSTRPHLPINVRSIQPSGILEWALIVCLKSSGRFAKEMKR